MTQKKKILVGLSGGVDSAVAAHLLLEQGYDVTAGFMINYFTADDENCTTKKDLEVAKEVAEYLKIPFFTFDYVKEYEKIILNYIYEGYKQGITPNPDVFCNSEVKFKIFLSEALELGFDAIATGHYARIIPSVIANEVKQSSKDHEKIVSSQSSSQGHTIFHLLKGVDPSKDQSYFLSFLTQEQLSRSMFPIGHLKKSEVREIAENIGLPNAQRKDSQGLCFVGKVDFEEFLKKKLPIKKGNIVDVSGKVLGEHDGVYFYTIGQRKGLNIGGLKDPVFVIGKNIAKNELIVGIQNAAMLYGKILTTKNMHFVADMLDFPVTGKAKIRYRQEDQEVTITQKDGKYEWEFLREQRAIAAGQVASLYIGDELVCSGIIE